MPGGFGAGALLPLQFDRVKPVDLGAAYQQAEQTLGLRNQNIDTEQRRNALQDYSARLQSGDPRASEALATQPQALVQVTAARNAMSQEQRTKFDFDMGHRARFAVAVGSIPPGPAQQEAWNNGLRELLQTGAINREQFTQLNGKPVNPLLLRQYQMLGGMDFIKQARMDAASERNAANFNAGEAPAAAPQQAPAMAPPVAPPNVPQAMTQPPVQPSAGAPGLAPGVMPPSALNPSPAPASAGPGGIQSKDSVDAVMGGGGAPAAPQSAAWPVAADAPQAAPAAPVAPPAPRAAADEAASPGVTLPPGMALSDMLPGNPRVRQQLRAAEQALLDPWTPEVQRKFAEKVFERASKELELTNDQKEYTTDMVQASKLGRPFVPFGDWLKDQSAKKATNVNQIVEAAGNKQFNEMMMGRYRDAQVKAQESSSTINMYETMDRLLDNPAVYTGTGAGAITELKKAATTLLGIPTQGLGPAEVAQNISRELSIQFKKQSGDPQTNAYEARVYSEMAGGIGQSAEGRRLQIQLRINDLEYQKEVAKVYRKNLDPKTKEISPNVDEDLLALAAKRREKLGLFLEKAQEIAAKQPQPGPTAGVDPNAAMGELLKKIDGRK
jgi:hypothetical protein